MLRSRPDQVCLVLLSIQIKRLLYSRFIIDIIKKDKKESHHKSVSILQVDFSQFSITAKEFLNIPLPGAVRQPSEVNAAAHASRSWDLSRIRLRTDTLCSLELL